MVQKQCVNSVKTVALVATLLLSGCATLHCPPLTSDQQELLQNQPANPAEPKKAARYYQFSVQCLSDQTDPKNFNTSIQWLQLSAVLGDANAQYKLANAYIKGIGVPVNEELAFSWMLQSAQQGNVFAQASLSYMYANGIGITPDQEMASYWQQQAQAN